MPPVSTGGNGENAGRDFRRELQNATDALAKWDPYPEFKLNATPVIIAQRQALAGLRKLQTELRNADFN